MHKQWSDLYLEASAVSEATMCTKTYRRQLYIKYFFEKSTPSEIFLPLQEGHIPSVSVSHVSAV